MVRGSGWLGWAALLAARCSDPAAAVNSPERPGMDPARPPTADRRQPNASSTTTKQRKHVQPGSDYWARPRHR